MATKPRFVLDTNVIISALLLKGSTARQAFDKAVGEGCLLLSPALVVELNDVLRRKRFDRYVLEGERMEFVTALVRDSILIEPQESIRESRDPKDNQILELAVSGKAACIISGDEDLLVLHPFRGIPILSPRQFIRQS